MKSKTAIIGGSGFIGTHLISVLDIDHVANLDKNPSSFFNQITKIVNVLDQQSLNRHLSDFETVVLLAAEHRDDVSPSSLYYEVNGVGTENVLKAMDQNDIKNIIFTSSVAVYGLNKNNPDEKDHFDPFNHYGKSKLQAENILRFWYDENPKERSVTIIRPTVVFGERNRGNVYNLLKQISRGRFIMVGNGLNKKSMCYVRNLVGFIEDRLKFKPIGYEVYNYSDKPDFDMKSLVHLVQQRLDINSKSIKIPYVLGIAIGVLFDFVSFIIRKKLSISSVRVKKFCATTQFDSKKAHSVYCAPFTLMQGLSKTIDHEFIYPKDN